MGWNKDVIQRQQDMDAAAVERALSILRTARQEVDGWHGITTDTEARKALQDTINGLDDLESDLRGSTADIKGVTA